MIGTQCLHYNIDPSGTPLPPFWIDDHPSGESTVLRLTTRASYPSAPLGIGLVTTGRAARLDLYRHPSEPQLLVQTPLRFGLERQFTYTTGSCQA